MSYKRSKSVVFGSDQILYIPERECKRQVLSFFENVCITAREHVMGFLDVFLQMGLNVHAQKKNTRTSKTTQCRILTKNNQTGCFISTYDLQNFHGFNAYNDRTANFFVHRHVFYSKCLIMRSLNFVLFLTLVER